MDKKIIIIMTSLIVGTMVMSAGYGSWQKKIYVEGEIVVEAVYRGLDADINGFTNFDENLTVSEEVYHVIEE